MWLLRPSRLLALASLAWSAWWFYRTFDGWAHERWCLMVAGPWLPCGRGADAWREPLLLALMPLAVLGCWMAFRLLLARPRAR